MSASESITLDRILRLHETELIDELLDELPSFVRDRQPRVMLEGVGHAIARWCSSVARRVSSGSS